MCNISFTQNWNFLLCPTIGTYHFALTVGTVSNLIKDVDQMGRVAEGANRIQTWIGGTPLEIRYFIQNQTVINIDAFIEHSSQSYFNTVVLP